MMYGGGWQRQESPPPRRFVGLKVTAAAVVLIFAGVLAYVVGERLSDEALGVLAGAVCGVGAAIPTTILVLFVASKLRGREEPPQPPQPQYTRPMVVPPMMMYPPQMQEQQRPESTWHQAPQRRFIVMGEEDG